MKYHKSKCNVLGKDNSRYEYRLGQELIEKYAAEKGFSWMKNWKWSGNVHLQPRKSALSWAVSKEPWPAGWGSGSVSQFYSSKIPFEVLCLHVKSSVQDRHGHVGVVSEESHKIDQCWSTSPMQFILKRRVWWDLIAAFWCLNKPSEKERGWLFTEVDSDSKRRMSL